MNIFNIGSSGHIGNIIPNIDQYYRANIILGTAKPQYYIQYMSESAYIRNHAFDVEVIFN